MEELNESVLVAHIRRLLNEPCQESEEHSKGSDVVLIGGMPGEVMVRIRASKVDIAMYSAVWMGAHQLEIRPVSIASLNWRRLPIDRLLTQLAQLISIARELRLSTFRVCGRCFENKPPEWMHGSALCQACAETHLGVVY